MDKKKLKLFLYNLIFIIGGIALCYPFISRYLYDQASRVEVNTYQEAVQQLSINEVDRRIFLAQAYNDQLSQQKEGVSKISDPFSTKDHEEGRAAYAHMLEINEQIGTIEIPKINEELPVFAGTGEEVLQKGIGHLEGTSLPIGGKHTHSVLTGHRGLPNARLFSNLDKLKKDDIFYFKNLSETLAYKVDRIDVILPDEIEYLDIVPNQDYMTLITCTPYMINSHRLLVRGHRVPYTEEEYDKEVKTSTHFFMKYRWLLALLLLILILLIIFWQSNRKKVKHRK
ncbi:class C sortase [Facklamia miroungae]|uniref:Sortase A n=1 Tax=Facklamia miroungae TaxID=120956 RepID=A0A1G7PCE7_9LACT|nr:class C sortase [Facklamia miroungae]NKZ28661.1 class C sortase [Facklamia miroungae]SDF83938.1 sortase A [Facklamia miroungae]